MDRLIRNDNSAEIEEAIYDGRDFGYEQALEEQRRMKEADVSLHTKRLIASVFLLFILTIFVDYFQVKIRLEDMLLMVVGAVACYLFQRIWKHDFRFF